MKVLLVAPHDPRGGNFTFGAPPLGVWRICGFLQRHGIQCTVYDPNLSPDPREELACLLWKERPAVVGFSFTGLTLPHDLSLVHLAKGVWPDAVLLGGGIEATFNYAQIFSVSPLDYCIAGEGEIPLLEICDSLQKIGHVDHRISGLVYRDAGSFRINPNCQLDYPLFRFAAQSVPYGAMPIRAYWENMRRSCREREGHDSMSLQEINCIRIMTSNYCPMGCRFCGYTNFLNQSCAGRTTVVRLTAEDIIEVLSNVVSAYPDVQTIIFQDDLFIHRNDDRIVDLCHRLIQQKQAGVLPEGLSFIATTRVDSMRQQYLKIMKRAGFRLIGYGIESFSERVLKEYGKQGIFRFIDGTLHETLNSGITPFLDIILASPESTLNDVILTLNRCLEYLLKGCEISIYPTVIPFSGAEIASDPQVQDLIVHENAAIPGTDTSMVRGTSIQPRSPEVQRFLATVNTAYNEYVDHLKATYGATRFPSRLRSMVYILSAIEQYPELLRLPAGYLKTSLMEPLVGYRLQAEGVAVAQ
jgi:anaerobic magnesium-protoporphyrin IX monomethyl ester cyclase